MDNLPVNTPGFWTRRLERAKAMQEIHRAVYDVPLEEWDDIQRIHSRLLPKLVHPGEKVLDAACGYGGLLDCLPRKTVQEWWTNDYIGIDLCPAFIEEANIRLSRKLKHPNPNSYLVADLADLSRFEKGEFDVCIARSLEGMVVGNMGIHKWRIIQAELLRVAKRLVLLNYTHPETYRIISDVPDVETDHSHKIIDSETESHLYFRFSPGRVVEITDIFVPEEHRRQGVGRKLIELLLNSKPNAMFAFTRQDNAGAREFYESLEFERMAFINQFYEGAASLLYVWRNEYVEAVS